MDLHKRCVNSMLMVWSGFCGTHKSTNAFPGQFRLPKPQIWPIWKSTQTLVPWPQTRALNLCFIYFHFFNSTEFWLKGDSFGIQFFSFLLKIYWALKLQFKFSANSVLLNLNWSQFSRHSVFFSSTEILLIWLQLCFSFFQFYWVRTEIWHPQ